MVVVGGNNQSNAQEPRSSDTNSSSNSNDNTKYFVSRIFYEDGDEVYGTEINSKKYGVELILFDNNDKVIERILITDSGEFTELIELLGNMNNAYVPYTSTDVANLEEINLAKTRYDDGEIDYDTYLEAITSNSIIWSVFSENHLSLEDILQNTSNSFEINATKFNGLNSSEFSREGHTHSYANEYHATNEGRYGLANDSLYGHVKVYNGLDLPNHEDATVLSAYQGNVLNTKIDNLTGKNAWWSEPKKDEYGYLEYNVNQDLRLISCNFYYKDYKGFANKSMKAQKMDGSIPVGYRPKNRVTVPLYRGDVTISYNTDGTITLFNLTKIKSMNISSQVMWHY